MRAPYKNRANAHSKPHLPFTSKKGNFFLFFASPTLKQPLNAYYQVTIQVSPPWRWIYEKKQHHRKEQNIYEIVSSIETECENNLNKDVKTQKYTQKIRVMGLSDPVSLLMKHN